MKTGWTSLAMIGTVVRRQIMTLSWERSRLIIIIRAGSAHPCYNAQIAVSDGVIVNADIYQRPADAKTFIPFVERYHENTGEYPEYTMADAGYGTYDNYMFCTKNGIELAMKYPMYAKKHEAAFKKKIFDSRNWETNEQGYKGMPERTGI